MSIVIGPLKERLEFTISQVDLLAGTAQSIVCPVDGFIDGMDIIVETAITTGGTVALLGGGAVYNNQNYLDLPTAEQGLGQGDTAFLPGVATFTATAWANTAPTNPGIVTLNNHGFSVGQPLLAGGTVPTGFSAGTVYYVSALGYGPNNFNLSTTPANAFAGVSITASGSASTTGTLTTGSQGTVAVTGMSQVIPNAAAKGTVYALGPVPSGDDTNLVKAGQLLNITLASFATAGALTGFIRFRSNR